MHRIWILFRRIFCYNGISYDQWSPLYLSINSSPCTFHCGDQWIARSLHSFIFLTCWHSELLIYSFFFLAWTFPRITICMDLWLVYICIFYLYCGFTVLSVWPADDLGGATCVLAGHETGCLSFSDGGAVSTSPPSECRARSAHAWDTGVVLCLPCILWRLTLIWQYGFEKVLHWQSLVNLNCQSWAVCRGICEVFMCSRSWENPQFHLKLADVCSEAVISPGLFLLTVVPFNLPLLWNFIPQMFSKLSCVFDLYDLPCSPGLFSSTLKSSSSICL